VTHHRGSGRDMGASGLYSSGSTRWPKAGAISPPTLRRSISHDAGFTQRPQTSWACTFFSPANVMKLLEVVRGASTAKMFLRP